MEVLSKRVNINICLEVDPDTQLPSLMNHLEYLFKESEKIKDFTFHSDATVERICCMEASLERICVELDVENKIVKGE